MTLTQALQTPAYIHILRYLYVHEQIRITSVDSHTAQTLASDRLDLINSAHAYADYQADIAYDLYLTRQINAITDGSPDKHGSSSEASESP